MRLRDHLLRWLLVPLFLLWIVSFCIAYQRSLDQAHEAYDRTLLGSALAMAERVGVQDGAISVDVPYAALEMLETGSQDRIFYKVSCVDPKTVITGHDDLPSPRTLPTTDRPYFQDAAYHGEAIRLVTLLRPVYDSAICSPLLIQVGETIAARQALSKRILVDSAVTQAALIALAAGLIAFGVRRGLLPLQRIRDEIRSRGTGDLTPIEVESVPREVVPLIEAINHHTENQRQLNDVHRRFIDDASHQLKTPLTVLKTQVTLALHQNDPQAARRILEEIRHSTDATSRAIQQLLALARSDGSPAVAAEPLDLTATARDATFELLPYALGKRIDLGFDDHGAVSVDGSPALLRELVTNLVDNAIRYTPEGGHIAVSVGTDCDGKPALTVEDDGPGIAPEERTKVFERFYRCRGMAVEGCGLGLAIARQICSRHGATIALANGSDGRGLRATVTFG